MTAGGGWLGWWLSWPDLLYREPFAFHPAATSLPYRPVPRHPVPVHMCTAAL